MTNDYESEGTYATLTPAQRRASIGATVQLHPATDRWMMGDRYGVITRYDAAKDLFRIKLNVSGKSILIQPGNVLLPRLPRVGSRAGGPEHGLAAGARKTTPGLVDTIRPGDRVTILIHAGIGRNGQEWKEATGRAVMRGDYGWVLNMGGRHGTPGIASVENTISVSTGKKAASSCQRSIKRR